MRQFVTATIALGLSMFAWSQSRKDYSGEWQMNPERSKYGLVPKPEKMVRKIEHKDPKLHIVSSQSGARGQTSNEYELVADGQERELKLGNAQVKATARWEDGILRVDTKRPFQSGELVMQERWTLSEDRKTLTINTHIIAPAGETDITVVLDRQ